MNMRKLCLSLAVATLTISAAGCDGDDDNRSNGITTLKQFAVADINTRTADDREPIELNDLALDTSNEDAAAYDDLLQSL